MIGSRIPLRRLQASLVIILLLGFVSISESLLSDWQILPVIGGVLIALCVIIRTLSSIYIASYKNVHLITQGPYSLSRNPLYLCWLLGAIGIGFTLHSILLAAVLGMAIFLIYNKAIALEEERLLRLFPQEFSSYRDRTPRWIGIGRGMSFRLSHRPSPKHTIQSFLEGLSLYLIYPFNFIVKIAQTNGDLPVILSYF